MVIDEAIIAEGITAALLAKLIERHALMADRYETLRRYYTGGHDILHRRKEHKGAANNRIVSNHAKYITDITTSYLVGNPVKYAPSKEYDIAALDNAYLEQDMAGIDTTIEKHSSIYGRAYELVYMDGASKPRSAVLKPWQAFVVYNDDCTHYPLFGVYYYKTHDIDGNVSGIVCNVYTDAAALTYESKSDNWSSLELTSEVRHYFGEVPLIEYENNEEKQGDFEQLISLIDAYNTLQSDRVNDKEQFVDAFLFLCNCEIDSEQAQRLREERILMGFEGARAEYLSKTMNEADTKVLRDDIKDDIHRLSHVPDLSDESFGNNLSGVAIKYKLLGFEQHVKNKERFFAAGLKKRFAIYNYLLSIKSQMQIVPTHRVDIIFTHNLPANNLEVSQMINGLSGMVTPETLLGQLDFISDPKEEAADMRKRKTADMEETARINKRSNADPAYKDEK